MRALLIAILGLFLWSAAPLPASAGTYQADGTYSGTPAASVVALFTAFPNGGDGFVNGIRELLIANPALADDVAYLATRGAAGQGGDAAAGMAQAFLTLSHSGNTNGAALIVNAAQLSGNPVVQTAVAGAVGNTTIETNRYGNPVGQTNCRPQVSQAAPTTCQ